MDKCGNEEGVQDGGGERALINMNVSSMNIMDPHIPTKEGMSTMGEEEGGLRAVSVKQGVV